MQHWCWLHVVLYFFGANYTVYFHVSLIYNVVFCVSITFSTMLDKISFHVTSPTPVLTMYSAGSKPQGPDLTLQVHVRHVLPLTKLLDPPLHRHAPLLAPNRSSLPPFTVHRQMTKVHGWSYSGYQMPVQNWPEGGFLACWWCKFTRHWLAHRSGQTPSVQPSH